MAAISVRASIFARCRRQAVAVDVYPSRQQRRRQRVAEGLKIDLYDHDQGAERHIIPSRAGLAKIKVKLAEARADGIAALKAKRAACQQQEKDRMTAGKKAILKAKTKAEMGITAQTVVVKNLAGDKLEIEKQLPEIEAKARALAMVRDAEAAGLIGVFVTTTSYKRASANRTPSDIARAMRVEWGRLTRRSREVCRLIKRCPQADGTPHDHGLFYLNGDDVEDLMELAAGWSLGSVKVRLVFDGAGVVDYMFSHKNSCPAWARTWQIRANNFSHGVAKVQDTTTFTPNHTPEAGLWRAGQDLARPWTGRNGKIAKIWTPAGLCPTVREVRDGVKKSLKINRCGDRSIKFFGNNRDNGINIKAVEVIEPPRPMPPPMRPWQPTLPHPERPKRRMTRRDLVKSLTRYVGDQKPKPEPEPWDGEAKLWAKQPNHNTV